MARRQRGTGSWFYSKSDGCWIGTISLGTRNGKRVRRKVRAATERAVKARLEELRRTHETGTDPMTMTLDAYMSDWLRDVRPTIRASTLRSYQGHVEHHISPLLGGIPVARLTPSDVRRLIATTLRAGKSPATVGRIVSTLHNAIAVAHREGSLPRNAAAVKLPRVERQPIRAMTMDDAAALLDAVTGHPFEAVYRLLLGSGMRLGEALGLDWPDVHDGYVTLRVSKTQVRAVPISADAQDALTTKLVEVSSGLVGPVFVGPRKGQRLRGDVVYHAWQRLLEAKGLEKMRVHDLRHGVATLMLSQGIHMRYIGDQLGHKNERTTHQYAHLVPEAQRAAISVLDSLRRKK